MEDMQRGVELCDKIHLPTLVTRLRESLDWYGSSESANHGGVAGIHCEALRMEAGLCLFTIESVRELMNDIKGESTRLEDVLKASTDGSVASSSGRASGLSKQGSMHEIFRILKGPERDPVLYFSSHEGCFVQIEWRGRIFKHWFLLTNATEKLMTVC